MQLCTAIQRVRAEEKLQKSHNELEHRVQERTVELLMANQQLKQEIEERKHTEERLEQSRRQLKFLSSQLLTAHEKERKRIAGELHDSIGASLSAIKYKVENTIQQREQSFAITQSLKDIVPTVQQAIEESRRIMADLRPSMLDDLGILPTIDWHCREFQRTYSHLRIEKKIDLSENEVPTSLKTVVYRILQEALNNIAKHSNAERVHLSFRKTEGAIELVIQDNGKGFDVEEVFSMEGYKRGLGLNSMKERAELSGGSLTIESIRGAGTAIRASWPIEQSP
jgi:signal transduction histidine kinase